MKLFLGVTIASLYALTIRLVYGFLGDYMGIMSTAFIIVTPLLIGFLTVIFIPVDKIKRRISAFFFPWVTAIVILAVTMAFNLEGAICWIMVFPLFAVASGVGGLIAYQVKHKRHEKKSDGELLDEKINNSLNVSLAFVIPILLGFIEGDRTLTPEYITVQEEIVVSATTSEVWKQVLRIDQKVYPEEGTSTWISDLMGFPKHLKTTQDKYTLGGRRVASYEKGLYFEEIITEIETEKKLVLEINTDPENIPPTVMDEHILIGGEYFDVLEDTYELEVLDNKEIKVTLSSKFYINTPFNWYTGLWAKFLLKDVLHGELEKIQDTL